MFKLIVVPNAQYFAILEGILTFHGLFLVILVNNGDLVLKSGGGSSLQTFFIGP